MRVLDDLCDHWQVNITDPCAFANDNEKRSRRLAYLVTALCAGLCLAAAAFA